MSAPAHEEEQKVRVQPGATGRSMLADSDDMNNSSSMDNNNNNNNNKKASSDKEFYDHEWYSGLQVVGDDGPQVVTAELPELAASHQKYAEHRAFGQHPAPQVVSSSDQSPEAVDSPPSAPGRGAPGSPPLSGSTLAADHHHHQNHHQYNGGKNPFDTDPARGARRRERICGMKKRVFWAVLALAIFAVIVAIALGLGLGLGVRNSNSTSSSTSSSSSTSASLPAATATATATGDTDIICPTANRTLYSLSTSTTNKTYLVLCGRDYNSAQGAFDLTSMNITTFEGCLNECGSTDGCIAVGWGTWSDAKTCWLKSAIGEPNQSANWYAAVEQDSG